MENITHKIRFKSGEHEIEIIGTKKFTEHWFDKLHGHIIKAMPMPETVKVAPPIEIPEAITKRKPKARKTPKRMSIKSKAVAPRKSAAKAGRKPKVTPSSTIGSVMYVAYNLQEKKGMSHLFIKDIRAGMMEANMKIPEKSGYLSHAIRYNLVRGYLRRTDKKVGTQKAFCVSKTGKKYVEGGFKKRKSTK